MATILIQAEQAEWDSEKVERIIETLVRCRAVNFDDNGVLTANQK